MMENEWSYEIEIKESEGGSADIVVMIANMINVEFSGRGLAPHKFMPMLGVHPAVNTELAPKNGAATVTFTLA